MYEPEDDLLAGRPAPEQPEEWDDDWDEEDHLDYGEDHDEVTVEETAGGDSCPSSA